MFYGATNYGAMVFLAGLVLLIIAIYLDIIQLLPLFFNASTMLFSIVAAAPLIQLRIDWVELCLATLGGGIFFWQLCCGDHVAGSKVCAKAFIKQAFLREPSLQGHTRKVGFSAKEWVY